MNIAFVKENVRKALSDPDGAYFDAVNDVLAFATVLSLTATVTETIPLFAGHERIHVWIEWLTVGLFTIEYGARVWSSEHARTYVLSPLGIIDIAAILPSYLGLGNFTFLKIARVAKTVRVMSILGRTNVSRVKKKGEELLAQFDLPTRLILVVFGVISLTSVYAFIFLTHTSLTETPAIFIGILPLPNGLDFLGSTLFVIGKVAGLLFLGLSAGMVGKHLSRRLNKELPETFIVLDTEYTAWEGSQERHWSGPNEYRELVQIGAVKVESTDLKIMDTFSVLIRPVKNPKLSTYFTVLTGISQTTVDEDGKEFQTVIHQLHAWCEDCDIYCYGHDGDVIEENCRLSGMKSPFRKNQFHDIRQYFMAHGIPAEQYMSSTIVRAFGATPARAGHNALHDALTTLDALRLLRKNI